MVDFSKLRSPAQRAALCSHNKTLRRIAALTNHELAAFAQSCMQNCARPHFERGAPVYDATMWHIVLPQLIARVRLAPTPDPAPLDGLAAGVDETPDDDPSDA